MYKEARTLQQNGKYDEAIGVYMNLLLHPEEKENPADRQLTLYTDVLVQLMNTFQSAGKPEECISALQEIYMASPIIQNECLRDYYSVLGYALSRTEKMDQAEDTILKALTLPLHKATPERYFRDFAYAAAVFYSNPKFQTEVINWCKEALVQAQLCQNTSGQQWVMSMLGSLYKRNGNLNDALVLYQQSIKESVLRNDDLGVLNSLNSLVDLFLYWDIPEYANMYASEAISVEKGMTKNNPMVSAQTYINKGRALHQLGKIDSISFYLEEARKLCEKLPYNSGMVDINLLDGICLTEKGGNSLKSGIEALERVIRKGTVATRAKAYHRLAQTYLEHGQMDKAEIMLDSLHQILNKKEFPEQILHIDYKPILDYYLKNGNQLKVGQYVEMMLQEQETFRKRGLNYNLIEAIVDLQTGSRLQELKIKQLKQANQRLWLLVIVAISVITIAVVINILLHQRRKHIKDKKHTDAQLDYLVKKLNQTSVEKDRIAQELKEFLTEKNNRYELETITPYILKESGETKFRKCFELLYPVFLPRLREKVPSISRREELLSMLVALKQDNKNIAELLAIAPRSVLMLRHRFRQKIGLNSEYSLENFINDLLQD